MAAAQPDLTPNLVLADLRDNAGLSQHRLATELNRLSARKYNKHSKLTAKTVWRWETGRTTRPSSLALRLLADYFNVEISQLGFVRPHRPTPPAQHLGHATKPATPFDSQTLEAAAEQDFWRDTRKALSETRRSLAILAERLYPTRRLPGLEHTGVLTTTSWLPATPIPLSTIRLTLDPTTPAPPINGGEPETAAVRPRMSGHQRYLRYHHAVRDLSAPTLFENRLCFRLTGLNWATAEMRFGYMGFFDSIDTNEALAHETALHHLAHNHLDELVTTKPSWRGLAFRKLIGDPFDLTRRPVMGAIGTLTIRGGESPSLVLHHRDGNKVAGGGGMTHLLPAGIFQPSSVLPAALANDFSIWRNIQREYAEELLGHDEYDGSGHPINYHQQQPFTTMDHALETGDIRVWCLGVTLDALTLSCDILTVAVIAPTLYDTLFARAVNANTEGLISTRAIPFEAHTLQHLHQQGQLSPGAAAATHLAWQHRAHLLA